MITVTNLPDLRQALTHLPSPIGLVPTMGFLHEGHLSLVRNSRAECATTVVSIFINPAQFSPDEDLASYPQDLSRDLAMLEAENVDLVWTPTPQIMYPDSFQTWVDVEQVTQPLEGDRRPGHFRGVTTIVAKLFNAVQPQKAYFGQKDAQQAVVIRRMTHDLNFPIDIVICPIVREPDGLAMSSRNSYLDRSEREAAAVLYRALTTAQSDFESGEREAEKLRSKMISIISSEPLARLQYVSCADPDSLQEIQGVIDNHALLSMAVYVGKTRLIDNTLLNDQNSENRSQS